MLHRHSSINWNLSVDKFLTKSETCLLREWSLNNRRCFDRLSWIDWFLSELLLNTGLRVAEVADLECGDVVLRDELSYVFVRNGKGGKSREVFINSDFQNSVKDILDWKKSVGEGINCNDPLLYSPKSKGKYSTRGLQKAFKRCLKNSGISVYHSIHHARHTFASLLLSSSNNNLKLVQSQLGHSSINVTQVYLHLFNSDIHNSIENLF